MFSESSQFLLQKIWKSKTSESASEEPDLKKASLFCGEVICDESKLPMHRRIKIIRCKKNHWNKNVLQYQSEHDDEFDTSIVERIHCVLDLIAVEINTNKYFSYIPCTTWGRDDERATYGRQYSQDSGREFSLFWKKIPTNFVVMNELMNQTNGDFVPNI